MYENNAEVSFNMFSGQELSSIIDTLCTMLDIEENQIIFCGDDDEKINVKNVEKMKKKLNQKFPVVLQQYGVSTWGYVEFLFEQVETNMDMGV